MKIVSWNVNGYRSIWKRNFADSILQINPDILCLKETKLKIVENVKTIPGYICFGNCSKVSGTAGVGIYIREKLADVHVEHLVSGRLQILETEDLTILNFYVPCNNNQFNRNEEQYIFFETVLKQLHTFLWQKKNVCLGGELNIPLTGNNSSNEKHCLDFFESENQASMKEILELGFIDVYRALKPLAREYSWYKNGKAETGIGARLD